MSKKRLALSFILLVVCSTPLTAIERLSLQVVCHLAEHRFRINLTDDEAAQIEAACASDVAGLLGKKISFLNFVGGEERSNRLVIRIGKTSQEADPNAFRAVNFEIEVTGDSVIQPGKPLIWEFRGVAEYLDVPSAATFADAIAVRFSEILENNGEQLVGGQLGRLQIAGSAFPLPSEQSWLLPFAREELGFADDSEFKIKAALIFPGSEERFTYQVVLFGDFASATNVPSEFHNKVKALHLGDDKLAQAASIQRLGKANEVRVEFVMISRYVPISRPERTSPSSLTQLQAGSGE
jgi:hypothetical protein